MSHEKTFIPLDKGTKDQIASVMLQVGTDEQRLEALKYCSTIRIATNNLVNCTKLVTLIEKYCDYDEGNERWIPKRNEQGQKLFYILLIEDQPNRIWKQEVLYFCTDIDWDHILIIHDRANEGNGDEQEVEVNDDCLDNLRIYERHFF